MVFACTSADSPSDDPLATIQALEDQLAGIPTRTPTPLPTATPTVDIASTVAAEVATQIAAIPTATPIILTPTPVPTPLPTVAPTATPTKVPTATPTATPTMIPTRTPIPTPRPTATPIDLSQLKWMDREYVLTGQYPLVPEWLEAIIFHQTPEGRLTRKLTPGLEDQPLRSPSSQYWCQRLKPSERLKLLEYVVWMGFHLQDWMAYVRASGGNLMFIQCPPATYY